MAGTLYIVATPIGNLSDASSRMISTLQNVDIVFAEDTRVAINLLRHFDIETPLQRYDHHSHDKQVHKVIEALRNGRDVAYVSDAGTPGVEDPGGRLVETVAEIDNVNIVPIAGPSAVMTALSVSGFPADKFRVMGFPPKKKGRQTYFDEIAQTDGTVVLYESTHRIDKTIEAIAARQPERRMVIARELTKKFETILRGTAEELHANLQEQVLKGEFIVVLK